MIALAEVGRCGRDVDNGLRDEVDRAGVDDVPHPGGLLELDAPLHETGEIVVGVRDPCDRVTVPCYVLWFTFLAHGEFRYQSA